MISKLFVPFVLPLGEKALKRHFLLVQSLVVDVNLSLRCSDPTGFEQISIEDLYSRNRFRVPESIAEFGPTPHCSDKCLSTVLVITAHPPIPSSLFPFPPLPGTDKPPPRRPTQLEDVLPCKDHHRQECDRECDPVEMAHTAVEHARESLEIHPVTFSRQLAKRGGRGRTSRRGTSGGGKRPRGPRAAS